MKPNFKLLNQNDRLYQIPNPLIGLTGGIATGKSTAASYLRELGYEVIDADILVKEIYLLKESIEFVQSIAPRCIGDGKINFPKLRELVFKDTGIKKQIEEYIYSLLPDMFLSKVKDIPSEKPIFYDVPLLFEKKLNIKSDYSIVVYSPREVQIERLIQRDQIAEELASKIISTQMDIEEKRKLADYVIENVSTINHLQKSIDQFIKNSFTS